MINLWYSYCKYIWGFPKIGLPLYKSSICVWDFPWWTIQRAIRGYPIYGNPHISIIKIYYSNLWKSMKIHYSNLWNISDDMAKSLGKWWYIYILVGGAISLPWKMMEFVNGVGMTSHISKIKFMFETTSQIYYSNLWNINAAWSNLSNLVRKRDFFNTWSQVSHPRHAHIPGHTACLPALEWVTNGSPKSPQSPKSTKSAQRNTSSQGYSITV